MRLTLSGIFLILILWKPIYFSYRVLFAKCNVAHRLLDQRVKSGLRAKQRFLGFARKSQPSVTGKTAILEICP